MKTRWKKNVPNDALIFPTIWNWRWRWKTECFRSVSQPTRGSYPFGCWISGARYRTNPRISCSVQRPSRSPTWSTRCDVGPTSDSVFWREWAAWWSLMKTADARTIAKLSAAKTKTPFKYSTHTVDVKGYKKKQKKNRPFYLWDH
jgi:hypothetical protein